MKKTIFFAAFALSLGSCGIYSKYQPSQVDAAQYCGDSVLGRPIDTYAAGCTAAADTLAALTADTASAAPLHWRQIFTDPLLQQLICRGLEQNTDYRSAELRIEEARATLKAARLAFLPSFAIAPQGSVSSFDGAKGTKTYSIPLNMSWEIDIFGRMRNAKEQAKALYAKSGDYRQAVRSQLIANVANAYYTLATLRSQLDITEQTEEAWRETLTTVRALMKAGRYNEAGVSQMEATLHSVHTSVLELRSQEAQTENALATMLGETPRHYATASLADAQLPNQLSAGVPLCRLASRPDVRMAQRTIEAAFYGVGQARSAFYPSLVLSGSIGWTNSLGSLIVNPGKWLATALGSLTAPLLTRGQNEAQLRIAKAQMEEARLSFTQTLLNAGKEVNDALTECQTARDKESSIAAEIEALQKALRSTTLLMEHGDNTYLEVLTARQSLLSAQLTQTSNRLVLLQGTVNLFQALGGGGDETDSDTPQTAAQQ